MMIKKNYKILLAAIFLGLLFWSLPPVALAQQQLGIVETVEQGYLAHRRSDYDKAIEIYTTIIKRRGLTVKERAVSYLLRGESKRDKGDLEEAINDFTRALNQWPNYPQAIFFRGQVLAQLNRLREAYTDLARAVELDPQRESYQTNLALLKKRMENEGIPFEGELESSNIVPEEE